MWTSSDERNAGEIGVRELFGRPAAKPVPLWIFVGGVIAFFLVASLLYAALQHRPAAAAVTKGRPLNEVSTAPTRNVAPLQQALPADDESRATLDVERLLGGAGIVGAAPGTAYFQAPARIAGSAPAGSVECARLQRDSQALDTAARGARSAYQHDVLRSARSAAKARQLVLRC
jgi:hypothetical protein